MKEKPNIVEANENNEKENKNESQLLFDQISNLNGIFLDA